MLRVGADGLLHTTSGRYAFGILTFDRLMVDGLSVRLTTTIKATNDSRHAAPMS